jgi:hypothetical protein
MGPVSGQRPRPSSPARAATCPPEVGSCPARSPTTGGVAATAAARRDPAPVAPPRRHGAESQFPLAGHRGVAASFDDFCVAAANADGHRPLPPRRIADATGPQAHEPGLGQGDPRSNYRGGTSARRPRPATSTNCSVPGSRHHPCGIQRLVGTARPSRTPWVSTRGRPERPSAQASGRPRQWAVARAFVGRAERLTVDAQRGGQPEAGNGCGNAEAVICLTRSF